MLANSLVKNKKSSKRVIEWTPAEWAWFLTLLFLFVRFFTQIPTANLYVAYTGSMVMLSMLHMVKHSTIKTVGNTRLNGLIMGLIFAVLVIVTFSPYNTEQLSKFCMLLLDVYILVGVLGVKEVEGVTKVFYWVFSVVVSVTFAVYIITPSFFAGIPGASQGLFYSPVFFGVPDNNDTAVVVFILFCIAYKKQWKIGLALGAIYPFMYFGRQYILMGLIVAALTIWVVVGPKQRLDRIQSIRFTPRVFMALFIASTLAAIALSYIWTGFVIGKGTSLYKASLNDSSNAIRMKSNVYCLELMFDNPSFLLYGYDADVFNALGISATDYSGEANHLIDGKYRLVQPHEEVLNLVLKEGLLFAAFYYLSLAQLLSRIDWGVRGKIVLMAYFFGSMFLSGFFRDFRLIALIVVALIEEVPLGKRNTKSVRKKVEIDKMHRRGIR